MTSSGCNSVKVLGTTVGYSLVLWKQICVVIPLIIREQHGIQYISEMKQSKIHTMETIPFNSVLEFSILTDFKMRNTDLLKT